MGKNGISLIENGKRGLSFEQLALIIKTLNIDARFFFDQIDDVENAPGESPLEGIKKEIASLKEFVHPAPSQLDNVGQRVMSNQELYSIVQDIMYCDGTVLRDIRNRIEGYLEGLKAAEDKKRASGE